MSRCLLCGLELDTAGNCARHGSLIPRTDDGWSSCADLRVRLAAAEQRADDAEAALANVKADAYVLAFACAHGSRLPACVVRRALGYGPGQQSAAASTEEP